MKKNNSEREIQDWLQYLSSSPTAFHAARQISEVLSKYGFIELQEGDVGDSPNKSKGRKNQNNQGRGFYVLQEGTIVAFYLPDDLNPTHLSKQILPLRLWGAHTDSPSLKLKPQGWVNKSYGMLNTEVYGSPILHTWLDKPLGIAGKVFCRNTTNTRKSAKIKEHLISLIDPPIIIPNAAIHLNRDVNKGFSLSVEKHLRGIYHTTISPSFKNILADHLNCKEDDILSHDLFLFDPTPPKLCGVGGEMINASHLDNLAMVHAGYRGFLRGIENLKSTSKNKSIIGIAFFNHEEIGSQTFEGARSSFLSKVINRVYEELYAGQVAWKNLIGHHNNSMVVSADMSHGFHPSYEHLYEENHRPLLNQGPVIKYNANFRYSSPASTVAQIKNIFLAHQIPFQEYVHHGDIPCGSTIGPFLSSELAIPVVDLGNPMLAMHSLRETAGVYDHLTMIDFAEKFFSIENEEET